MSRILQSYSNKITSPFGQRILNGKSVGHIGIDIVGTTGSNSLLDYITAHSDGEVIKVVKNIVGFVDGGSYGNQVTIKHSDKYSTHYAHMKYNTIPVVVGDKVKQGQVIGYMGATGTSYGGHLHFEVRENNIKIDPKPYIDGDLPLLKKLVSKSEGVKEVADKRFATVSEMPLYAQPTIQSLMDKGYIGETQNLNMTEDMIRVLVIVARTGVFK